jgi:predicted phosphodiesterase
LVVVHYPDLVIYGHDHEVRVEGGARRLLNHGTRAGYLAPRATVVVVDLADLSVGVVDL